MKSIILYCSDYKKNTEKIAQVFAKQGNFELVNLKNISNLDIENYDLIGLGSGVYRESLSPKLYKLVDQLNLSGKNVFVFSTNGVGMKYYNKKLIRLLISTGAMVKGSFACKGSFTAKDFTDNKVFDFIGRLSQGHPNQKDFKKAERFIKRVLKSI